MYMSLANDYFTVVGTSSHTCMPTWLNSIENPSTLQGDHVCTCT